MKKYDNYKDSGIEWIGKIPEHWVLNRLKYKINYQKGKNPKNLNFFEKGLPYLSMEYLRGTSNQTCYVEDYNSYVNVEENEILLLWDGSNAGEFIKSKTGILSSTMAILKIDSILSEYIWYFLKSLEIKLKESTIGMGIPHVNSTDLKNQVIIIPSVKEQQKISSFLENKTSEINTLISKKQEMIKLLKEERVAIINNAVTKGINPDAKMKDSGIEWIGEIPEHWKVIPLRFIGKTQNGVSKGSEYFGSGFPFVSYGDVYRDITLPLIASGFAKSSIEDRENFSVKEGDIFFTRTSETIEEIGFASTCLETIENAIFSGFLIRFRVKPNILYKGFSKYYFSSNIHRNFFVKSMNIVTRTSLSQELLKKMPVLIPPINEQNKIALFLDEKFKKINTTIKHIENETELLKEYRTSLISEVVTGKIDVRGY